ncbi:RDD family protein [Sporosarcina sp. FA9]|uniref:RDD family protein n=1 Tax=Sporosarcina sp. FA9 TaxID=3413030 RepID=UPI003F65EA90
MNIYCSKCGNKLAEEDTFCSGCGIKVPTLRRNEVQNETATSFDGTIPHRSARPENSYEQYDQLRYAGFWQRAGATLIDIFLWLAFVITVQILFAEEFENVSYVPFLFLNVMYYGLLDSSSWQGTIGKKVMGIVVCDLKGNRISFFRALFRCIFHVFSQIILFIGFIMVAFTPKKQALHDMMTGCIVIKK